MTESPAVSPKPDRPRDALERLMLAIVIAATLILAGSLAMTKRLNHDEHQHLASGAMLARHGLLPYRDFPYFHMPYLPAIYAALFSGTNHLLLVSRLFSAVCAALTVALVAATTMRLFRGHSRILQHTAGIGATALFVTAAQFTQTTGRAWNFEPGTLCALGAFLCYATALRGKSPSLLFASGALVSLAIGIRVTFAPLSVALLLLLLLEPPPWPRRRSWALCLAGLATASLPALLLAASAPEQFFTGNFGYAELAYSYHMSGESPRTMTVPTKLRYLFKEIIRPNWPLMVAFVFAVVSVAVHARQTRGRWPASMRLVAIVFPFLLLGSLGPSPLRDQYFYPLLPLLTLGVVAGLAALPPSARLLRTALLVAGACAMVSTPLSFKRYRHVAKIADPQAWTPMQIHAIGGAISRSTPQGGRILTLSPTAALEGGRNIYPAFVTGPFAWRIGKFVDPERRKRLKIVAPDDLAALVRAEPPTACLTGAEENFEGAIVDYARNAGFERETLSDNLTLWRVP